jgi:biotin carboxyl carrier protein
MEHALKIGGEIVAVQVTPAGDGRVIKIGDRELLVENIERSDDWLTFSLDGHRYAFRGKNARDFVFVIGAEACAAFQKVRAGAKGAGEDEGGLLAPMAGQVLKVFVAAGVAVEKGQRLMILEAMKMEHEILAPMTGTVTVVHFAEGQKCQQGDVLVGMDAAE